MTTPNQIGKYVEPQLIGQGGFGSVYRALDPDLRRYVAIKVMHPQFAQDAEWVDRFQEEARFMARVDQHPNIARVIDLQQGEHGLFMVMDYYPNGNLEELIRSEGPFSTERSVGFLLQIARGLSAAHAAGIVHRDIKPLNVLLDDDFTCKITDFGIAASTDRSIYTRIGSPPYMAPEAKLGRRTDARADIYSLGVTLYQMLTGALPDELSQTEKPPDPRVQHPEIPERVVEILFKAIEFDAGNRYQSTNELIAELEAYVVAPGPTPFTVAPPPQPLRPLGQEPHPVDSAASSHNVAAASPGEPTFLRAPSTEPIVLPTEPQPSPAPKVSSPSKFAFLFEWGTKGSRNGQFFSPRGIAVDGAGNVYVADTLNNRAQMFDKNGRFLCKWDSGFHPGGIAIDAAGDVYVAETGNNRVQVFNSSGNLLRELRVGLHPRGVAVDLAGNVYVCATSSHQVLVFDSRDEFLREYGQLVNPEGIAVDGDSNVYVADTGSAGVHVFDRNGRHTRWSHVSNGDGHLVRPSGIAVDGAKNVFVADMGSASVQVFDGDGRFIHKWDSVGSSSGQFDKPRGIAVDGAGNVYVADQGNHRVLVFGQAR